MSEFVWVVTRTGYDHPTSISAVFSTNDEAQRLAAKMQANVDPFDETWEVEEWPVDGQPDAAP